MAQQLVLMGTFFVLPVYLQVVLGLDAFETGKRLLPMSVTMLVAALLRPEARGAARAADSSRRSGCWRSRRRGRAARHDRRELNETGVQARARALRRRRRPARVPARQRDHVVGVRADKTNEAGGLQGTAQNLGASLGTALIGAVLLAGLLTGFNDRIAENPALSAPVARADPGRRPRRGSRSSRPSRRTPRRSRPG